MPELTETNTKELKQDENHYDFNICHIKNIWTEPLTPQTEQSRKMTNSTRPIEIMNIQSDYAHLHTYQERYYYKHRYHDYITSISDKQTQDTENRH